jgi:pyruvate/2-oxoglutarate/acetoin dehydrogenase E1 component
MLTRAGHRPVRRHVRRHARLCERYGDEVIRDAPLCESATVGFAIGLAITGVRAVVEIEFFDFVGVAMDQIFNQAPKLHYFTGGKLTVPLVIRTPIVARMGMGRSTRRASRRGSCTSPGIKVAMPSKRRTTPTG